MLSDDQAKENYFYKKQKDLNHESQENTDKISVKDVGLIILFGLILPSFDQGSDYYTSLNYINYEHMCRSVEVLRENKTSGSCYVELTEHMKIEEARIRGYGFSQGVNSSNTA